MNAKRALITGVSGQDGSYLAELLVGKGYEVTGLIRSDAARSSPTWQVSPTISGSLTATSRTPRSLREAVEGTRPDELYHLAASTFVPASWDNPTETMSAIAGGTAAILAAARAVDPAMRVWVATSSEIFGDAGETPAERAVFDAAALAIRRRQARGPWPCRRHAHTSRHARDEWRHVQPRVQPEAAGPLSPEEGHKGSGRDRSGSPGGAGARRSRRHQGLVSREGRRARCVACAAA